VKILNKKYRNFLIIAVVVFVILSILKIPKLSINPGFDDYIPENTGNRAYLNRLDSIFGGNEKILIILKNDEGVLNPQSFERLRLLTRKLQKEKGIEHTFSLHDVIEITQEDGFTIIDPLVSEIPSGQKAIDSLKQRIVANEMARRLVSEDFSASAIVLTKAIDAGDHSVISAIEQVIEETPGEDEIHIGGLAYIRNSVKSYIKKDLVTLLPAALLLMIVMLYLFFREWKGVVLPFIVVVLSIVFSFGLMAVFEWEISIVTVLLPVMLIAIANDYGIHLINLYQEKIAHGEFTGVKDIASGIYRELRRPIVITGLTTIGGMLGLLSHQMVPAAQLGVLASLGIALALLLSLFFIPALLTFYKKPKTAHLPLTERNGFLNKVLRLFAQWVNHYPMTIVASFVLVAVISIGGIFLLKVDTNIEGYFGRNTDIRESIDLTNEKFGGSQYVSVLFSGNVLSPELLHRMEGYTLKIEELPHAGNILSPVTFFKELSKGIYSPGEPEYGTLPGSEAEAAQYLEIASLAGFADQAAQIIDYNNENARILVSLTDGSNQTGKEMLKALGEITIGDPMLNCIAGPGLSKIQIADMVIKGQITSLFLALFIIFVLLSFIFRSTAAGIKGSLPLLVATLFLFGLMGFLGISLDIVTALLSSIMIGVGVDYTIHFLWRYKAEYAVSNDIKKAVSVTLVTAGRGIIFNAFSVIIGFSVLMFSGFSPLRFFGVLVVVSIFSCLISALLLVPAIVTLTKPGFLEPKQS
jgi:hypothetical protein